MTTPVHDLWQVLRKNLTHRDLYPKRRYPLWTDPVTGLPCRSGPAPPNQQAAPRRKEKVIRESESERESLQARLLARAQVRRCLTETQYRRVAYLFGFDTPELSVRDVGEIEDVGVRAVHDSKTQAACKMERNVYLWLFWLLCKEFTLNAPYNTEKEARHVTAASEASLEYGPDWPLLSPGCSVTQKAVKADDLTYDRRHQTNLRRSPGELQELARHGFTTVDPYPGADGWESDRFTPRSPYDRDIDRLTDEFLNGSLTRVEYKTDMVMALAEERNPDGGADARHELRQEVEWAMSARSLGAITGRECDRRVSLALRAYVTGES